MLKGKEVLICGAGPTGLALALVLARHDVGFRLIDKAAAPFHGSRGKGLQPRTLEIFDDLGIVERILAAGGPYPPQREYAEDGSWRESPSAEPQPATSSEPYTTPWMVPQFLTEGVMRARLQELGHAVEFGSELIALEQGQDNVRAVIAGPAGEERIEVSYVVAADGGRSVVRNLLGIDFPGKTLGARAVVADITLHGLDRDAWHRFSRGSQLSQISLCPLAGTALFQLQAPLAGDEQPDLSAPGLTRMIAERTGRDDIVVDAVSWASDYQMNARLAQRYRLGRVFLAGDAAHVHPPTGGQGLNTSVQDAYNLGWKLAAVLAGAAEKLLDTYEEERRPVAESMLGLSTRLLDAAKRGDMRRGRDVQQLDLGYLDSSLALELPRRSHGALAGERAPDAMLCDADGRSLRLFDLYRGGHWTLLGFEVAREGIPERPGLMVHAIGADGDLVDDQGQFSQAYGLAPGDWIALRPDGYIGAVVSSSHRDALNGYLESVIPNPPNP